MPNFTVSEKALEQEMFKKVEQEDASAIKRVYLAGMKLLFSPQTHEKIFGEIEKELQPGADGGAVLGANMAHVMMLLHNESKGTMPPGAMIPAGTLLLAKSAEFLHEAGTLPMTDAVFSDAAHMMSTVLQSKYDPEFNRKIGAQPQQPSDSGQSRLPPGILAGGA